LARISFYLDEHIQLALAEALKSRGVDVLTTWEAGNMGLDDESQLAFANKNKRTLFSFNKRHFAKIHYEWMAIKNSHAGIILSDQLTIGTVLRRLMRLYFSLASDDMKNRLEYLSTWK
jgi:Domain of unknown function (DUF5615)